MMFTIYAYMFVSLQENHTYTACIHTDSHECKKPLLITSSHSTQLIISSHLTLLIMSSDKLNDPAHYLDIIIMDSSYRV